MFAIFCSLYGKLNRKYSVDCVPHCHSREGGNPENIALFLDYPNESGNDTKADFSWHGRILFVQSLLGTSKHNRWKLFLTKLPVACYFGCLLRYFQPAVVGYLVIARKFWGVARSKSRCQTSHFRLKSHKVLI